MNLRPPFLLSTLACTCLLVLTLSSSAQRQHATGFIAGLGDVAYTFKQDFAFNNALSPQTNVGYAMGIGHTVTLAEKFRLRAGVLFTQTSYTQSYAWIYLQTGDPFIPLKTTYRYFALEVPVQAHWKIVGNEKNSIWVTGGGQFGEVVSAREFTKMGDDSTKETDYSTLETEALIAVRLGCSLERKVAEQWSLALEPYGLYHLNALNPTHTETGAWGYGAWFSIHRHW